jgi:transcriptional regulator GlxA family with amidase domain
MSFYDGQPTARSPTSMTPMQYLKRVRLGEARHRMVVLGEAAAQAATAVGYRSASHFSRDYRRLYGRTPAADAVATRVELQASGLAHGLTALSGEGAAW